MRKQCVPGPFLSYIGPGNETTYHCVSMYNLFYCNVVFLDRVWTRVGDLTSDLVGKTVLVRARVHNTRGAGERGTILFSITDHSLHTSLALPLFPPSPHSPLHLSPLPLPPLHFPVPLPSSPLSPFSLPSISLHPGKLGFLVLRQQYHTVQAVLSVSETISKQMVKFATE